MNLESNMYDLVRDLYKRTYQFLPVYRFKVFEKVEREIYAPQFRDRIVSIFLYDLLAPILEPGFIDDSYSCRPGRGTSYAIKRFEHHIRSVTLNYSRLCYILKLDIEGYFMSIRHDLLENITIERLERRKRTKNPANGIPWEKQIDIDYVIWLTKLFIHRDIRNNCITICDPKVLESIPASKRLSMQPESQGIIIGDCCSQLFSNIIGDCIDQYMKRVLKRKHYGRYVDDFFDISCSRAELEIVLKEIEIYIGKELGLKLHPKKSKIYTILEGVEFVGAYVKPGRVYACKHTVDRFCEVATDIMSSRKSMTDDRSLEQRFNSYLGYLSQFDSYSIRKSVIKSQKLESEFAFDDNYKKTLNAPPTYSDDWLIHSMS